MSSVLWASLIKDVFEKRTQSQIKGWHHAQLAMLAMITLKWELVPQSQSAQFSNFKVRKCSYLKTLLLCFRNVLLKTKMFQSLLKYPFTQNLTPSLMGVNWSFSQSGFRPNFLFCFYFTFDSSKSKWLAPFITSHSEVLSKVLETYFDCPYNFLVSELILISWKKRKFLYCYDKEYLITLWIFSVADQVWSALQQGKMRWILSELS